jgi:hypothetical protein
LAVELLLLLPMLLEMQSNRLHETVLLPMFGQ